MEKESLGKENYSDIKISGKLKEIYDELFDFVGVAKLRLLPKSKVPQTQKERDEFFEKRMKEWFGDSDSEP